MKKVFSILLVMVLLAQSWLNVGVWLYYQTNKAQITAQFCVNKSRPAMHCNGQCYLGKQLKKAEEGTQKQSLKIERGQDAVCTYPILDFTATPVVSSDSRFTIHHNSSILAGTYSLPIKPPIV